MLIYRKHALIIFLFCFINVHSYSQIKSNSNDYIGKWVAKIPSSRVQSMDMMFEGAVIELGEKFTFTAQLMGDKYTGSWSIDHQSISLNNQDLPSNIILTELSTDSCIWKIEGVDARIPFFKKSEKSAKEEVADFTLKSASRNNLLGQWRNIQVEDPTKSEKYNELTWGGPTLNYYLELNDSGSFIMTRMFSINDNPKYRIGNWILDDHQILLEDESGNIEKLGILKSSPDSLLLLISGEEGSFFGGASKLILYYSRNLAPGLNRYLLEPEVLDTIDQEGIKIALKLPRDFTYDFFGEAYSDDKQLLMTLTLSKCFWGDTYEEALVAEKEDLTDNGHFFRFLDSDSEDYFVYEQKTLLGDTNYAVKHILTHEENVFCISVSSFLLENIHIMIESLKHKVILD